MTKKTKGHTANGMATKERKPRQRHIPGTEPPSHPDIDKAAEDYVDVRDRHMALLDEEVTRRDTLLRLMKQHGLREYDFEGKKVLVVAGEEKVKVKRAKDGDENGDE